MDKLVNMLFVNWRTTLFGLLGAMTTSATAFLSQQTTGAWPYLASLFLFLQGLVAKDHNVVGTPATVPSNASLAAAAPGAPAAKP